MPAQINCSFNAEIYLDSTNSNTSDQDSCNAGSARSSLLTQNISLIVTSITHIHVFVLAVEVYNIPLVIGR